MTRSTWPGRVHTARAPKLVSPAADQNSTWAKQADGLVKFLADGPGCLKKSPSVPQPCVPYNYGGFGGEPGAAVTGQGFQSSVYSVELQQPPPTQSRPVCNHQKLFTYSLHALGFVC